MVRKRRTIFCQKVYNKLNLIPFFQFTGQSTSTPNRQVQIQLELEIDPIENVNVSVLRRREADERMVREKSAETAKLLQAAHDPSFDAKVDEYFEK